MVFAATISSLSASAGTVFRWDFGDGRTATGPTVEHTYSWPGDYAVGLQAELSDGTIITAENTLSFPATPLPPPGPPLPPAPPTGPPKPDAPTVAAVEVFADAGDDKDVTPGAAVTLDGIASHGTGTTPLAFVWRQLKGPPVILVNRLQSRTSFTVPVSISAETTLVFELAVAQGGVYSTDQVSVTVTPPPPPPPAKPAIRFAVTPESGVFTGFDKTTSETSDGAVTTFSSDSCTATIRVREGGEYELTLHALRNLTQVWFPWSPTLYPCDRIYYPHLMGLEIDNHRLNVASWSDSRRAVYPGQTVFPGGVMEGETEGRGVFATNWPPQQLDVLYARGEVTMRYDEPLAAGQSRTYRCLVVDEQGKDGIRPWQKAIDRYKVWLRGKMQPEGLWPVEYPPWLASANGWSNVQLQDYDQPMDEVRYRWEAWGGVFPIVQTWGSMSDRYYGPNQGTGCCEIDTGLNPRNAELPALSQWIRDQGGHVGHYARPRNTGPVAGADPNADANRQWLLDWMDINLHQYNANEIYLDWFIARPLGPVLDVAYQFRDGVWGYETVCERAVDVYPTAFLMSGALWGGPDFNTVAYETLSDAPLSQTGIAFPRLVRYLLDDRIIFLGESNGDHVLWSTNHGAGYWGERQAFLLGCKLDWMQRPDAGGSDNPAVLAILEAWRQSNFWNRQPVYADTLGLTDVPAGVEVRRFTGSAGETILAIDNKAGVDSVTLTVDGQPVTLSAPGWLDIAVLPN